MHKPLFFYPVLVLATAHLFYCPICAGRLYNKPKQTICQ
nr:MAG TPA: Trm112p-like protein [Bacteriophage sp.]